MKLSIIIPAYNEEENIEQAVKGLCSVLEENKMSENCDILIFNDRSVDRTGEIADSLAEEIANVRVAHNKKNMGLGYNFREGVKMAKGEYITWFPGDNENVIESFVENISHMGKADIIIPYTSNMDVRPFNRRVISSLYTAMNNFFFGLNLKYYNGLCVYKRDILLCALPSVGDSFAFSAETLIALLKSGANYVEVPTKIKAKVSGKTSAFRLKNVISVIKAMFSLFWRVNIKRERVNLK